MVFTLIVFTTEILIVVKFTENWSTLFENEFVGNSLALGKNDYGISGIFYAWFLAPKINYCLVTDDFGVFPAKRTFKGYREEYRMIKLDELISL